MPPIRTAICLACEYSGTSGKIIPNSTLFEPENVGNCISQLLDFNISLPRGRVAYSPFLVTA